MPPSPIQPVTNFRA